MNHRLNRSEITLKNKMLRGLWSVVWLVLYRPTPRPLHRWRAMLLRLFGARIGRRVRIYQSARIWAPWNLVMEDDSCLGDFVDCMNVAPVLLKESAVVSQYCYLCAAGRDYRDLALPLLSGPIIVGRHAWVTASVFVGPGVNVGDGAVVTAQSSVFHDVPAWTIAGGNPAVFVRDRILYEDSPQTRSQPS